MISIGENEIHWRTFLEELVARGLRGVQLINSDDHQGLKAARKADLVELHFAAAERIRVV